MGGAGLSAECRVPSVSAISHLKTRTCTALELGITGPPITDPWSAMRVHIVRRMWMGKSIAAFNLQFVMGRKSMRVFEPLILLGYFSACMLPWQQLAQLRMS